MNKRSSLLLLPLLTAAAFAQDLADEAPEDVRRYTVEMIVFSYAQDVAAGTEVFVPDEPPVDEFPLDGAVLTEIEVLKHERSYPAADRYEIVMLQEEDFGLSDVYEHLQRIDAYEPLLHFGWTQPTYPAERTEARPLSSFVTPPEGLSGDLTLYLSRYLHLALSLELEESVPGFDFAGFGPSRPIRYRIEEDRIFRNGDLRYFDHPKFGALAKITRVEEQPAEEALTDDTELLGYDGG